MGGGGGVLPLFSLYIDILITNNLILAIEKVFVRQPQKSPKISSRLKGEVIPSPPPYFQMFMLILSWSHILYPWPCLRRETYGKLRKVENVQKELFSWDWEGVGRVKYIFFASKYRWKKTYRILLCCIYLKRF